MDNKTVLGVALSENGELAWTRRGDLRQGPEGFIQTGEGYLVVDDSGAPLRLSARFDEVSDRKRWDYLSH